MTYATKTLTEELAYLRTMHAEATSQRNTIIANSVGEDIADLVRAIEVLDRMNAERAIAA